jgi:hypothetical protein
MFIALHNTVCSLSNLKILYQQSILLYFVHAEFLQLVEGIYSAADLGLKFNMAKPSDDFIKVSELHIFF